MADGVWRTISGRRVFIKDGQSVSDAMKASGKFKDKKESSDEEKQFNRSREEEMIEDMKSVDKSKYSNIDDYKEKLDDVIREKYDYLDKDQRQAIVNSFIEKGDKSKIEFKTERVGMNALQDAKVGTRLKDNNGDIWKKTNDWEGPWHKEGSTDRASHEYLAHSKDIENSKFIDDSEKKYSNGRTEKTYNSNFRENEINRITINLSKSGMNSNQIIKEFENSGGWDLTKDEKKYIKKILKGNGIE